MSSDERYLKKELYDLIKRESSIFEFFQNGSLDGIWYWDLEKVENEWMSPQFWTTLGYDPCKKKHLASEWQDLIHPDDLRIAIENFNKHCSNPNHPYDQVIRYRHKNGSTVWVRCRGIAIRDENGKPIRMLGAHNELTQQKKAEEDIIKERDYAPKILNTVEAIIVVLGKDGRVSMINPKGCRLLGYNEEEIKGQHWFSKFLPQPDGMENVYPFFLKLIAGEIEEAEYFENPIITKTKEIRQIAWHNSLMHDEDGKVGGTLSYGEDITERREAEQSLRESEKKYRELFESNTDGIIRTDLDGVIQEVNPAFLNMVGYENFDDLKNTYHELTPEKWHTFENDIVRNQVFKRGYSDEYEKEYIHKDGTIFPISIKVWLVKDQDKPVGMWGIVRDISERKKAEDQLREREFFLNTLLDTIPIPVFYKDIMGRYIGVNRAFENFYGTSKESIIGKSVFDIASPELATIYHESDKELFDSGGIQVYESRVVSVDGKKHDVIFHKAVFTDSQKNVRGLIGAILDITQSKQNEKNKLEMKTRLQQIQKMESIGTLSSGIAHDFNNILFPIVGMSEMLLEDLPLGSPEHQSVQEIFNAGRRGSDLVKQILAFSRQTEHKMMPVSAQQVLKEVVKLTRSTIPSNIEVSHYLQSDCGLVIADPTQLHQIAMNLITNAFHAVEKTSGKISISLKEIVLGGDDLPGSALEPGKYAMISFADTGCGIDPEVMDKIFEPYFTTKEQGKGTGLGLAVVYGIVKEHGGDIRVYSKAGKGTTFNIYLPLAVKHVDQVSSPIVTIQPTGTERILLVDDEEPIAHLEKQMLERLGYRVTTRINSIEALEAFKANPDAYDLLITDITMPNMTGDRLARELIAIRPDMPIIICTGFSERLNQEKAASIGVKCFLMKPIVKAEMAKMVRKVLDEAKATDQH